MLGISSIIKYPQQQEIPRIIQQPNWKSLFYHFYFSKTIFPNFLLNTSSYIQIEKLSKQIYRNSFMVRIVDAWMAPLTLLKMLVSIKLVSIPTKKVFFLHLYLNSRRFSFWRVFFPQNVPTKPLCLWVFHGSFTHSLPNSREYLTKCFPTVSDLYANIECNLCHKRNIPGL